MVSGSAPTGPRGSPAERVRARLRPILGTEVEGALPRGYQRLGRVLLLRLPAALRPHFRAIGEAWRDELEVATVLTVVGPVTGELRRPRVEVIAGGPTETEVVEHGVRYRFDARRILFAAGNRTERARAGRLVAPGETVVDLFAGIGYFAIPAARVGRAARVVAVEKNPVALAYLRENARRNGVDDRIEIVAGDNRRVALEPRTADRVFLGFLPSAVPWVGRAVSLVRPSGGSLHVHLVADVHGGRERAVASVERAVRRGGATPAAPSAAREVKPYGPGRAHVVVDVRLGPRPA